METGKNYLLTGFYRFVFLDYLEHLALDCIKEFKELAPAFRGAFGSRQTRLGVPLRGFVIDPTIEDPVMILIALFEKTDSLNITRDNLTERDLIALSNFFEFRSKFNNLIDKYFLTPRWLRNTFLNFVHFIANDPDNNHRLSFTSPYGKVLHAPQFIIEVPGWDVAYEKPGDFETRAKDQFFEALAAYMSRVTADPHFEGFIGKAGRPEEYFRVKWLVRWTVQGWSFADILDEITTEDKVNFKDRSEDTIRKAFKKFAKFGLPVRRN